MNESCIPEELAHAAKRVVKRLAARGLTVIAAESCTAGLIAATLSVVDGAGKILHGSFVTYTKQAKSQALGIPMKILKKETSVAHRVASDMLRGALRRSPADIALAVTGVLGPERDEDDNPVGLVYIGCQARGRRPKIIRKRYGKHDPDRLRRRTVLDALRLLEGTASQRRRNP